MRDADMYICSLYVFIMYQIYDYYLTWIIGFLPKNAANPKTIFGRVGSLLAINFGGVLALPPAPAPAPAPSAGGLLNTCAVRQVCGIQRTKLL